MTEKKKVASKKTAKVKDPNKNNLKASEKLHGQGSRTELRGKKYREATGKIDKDKKYSIADAVKLAVETSPVKFDASVEIHLRTSADPKKADQMIRSSLTLPHGTGKSVRVIVFCTDEHDKACMEMGAVEAGGAELIEKVSKGFFDFDVAVAVPDMMRELAKVAKVLGPKGLMPNPKSGTVSPDPAKIVSELKKGKIEYRADSFGIIHSPIGKVSFGEKKIEENINEFLKTVKATKPAGIKGVFIKTVFLTTSMGPSVQVDEKEI